MYQIKTDYKISNDDIKHYDDKLCEFKLLIRQTANLNIIEIIEDGKRSIGVKDLTHPVISLKFKFNTREHTFPIEWQNLIDAFKNKTNYKIKYGVGRFSKAFICEIIDDKPNLTIVYNTGPNKYSITLLIENIPQIIEVFEKIKTINTSIMKKIHFNKSEHLDLSNVRPEDFPIISCGLKMSAFGGITIYYYENYHNIYYFNTDPGDMNLLIDSFVNKRDTSASNDRYTLTYGNNILIITDKHHKLTGPPKSIKLTFDQVDQLVEDITKLLN